MIIPEFQDDVKAFVVGTSTVLGSTWLFSYLNHLAGGTWLVFPLWFSQGFFWLLGLALMAHGLFWAKGKKGENKTG
jgi:ABC-type multidrug transport system permease subunit